MITSVWQIIDSLELFTSAPLWMGLFLLLAELEQKQITFILLVILLEMFKFNYMFDIWPIAEGGGVLDLIFCPRHLKKKKT